MIEKLNHFERNVLALKEAGPFSEADAKLCYKFFLEKLLEGHNPVNVLVELDELKAGHLQIKTFLEYLFCNFCHYRQMGHLAIVGQSNLLKNLVRVDNLFHCIENNGYLECYFDISQQDEAFDLLNGIRPTTPLPTRKKKGHHSYPIFAE